ncbi:site-specific integrase [Candidatus Dependentiae bacterium]|nr:site-specific integrase [Candidatus Dependentiae bacterium]
MQKSAPISLYDTLENFLVTHLSTALVNQKDYQAGLDFLKQYSNNKATFESYRREVERLVQWAWLIAEKSILDLTREDIENYIAFCLDPPKSWIGKKRVPRFISFDGFRKPNPHWRPFVASVDKVAHKKGIQPDKKNYHLSQKAIQEIFTVLNSFYNFLLQEEKVSKNPVALIKQKSRYIQKQQQQASVMRLTDVQWDMCIKVAMDLAVEDKSHERTLFILSALYLLYLRISELVSTERWTPMMGHFYQDSSGFWWFKTVGKGNKLRTIAVSDDMLKALERYRKSQGLSPLPLPKEKIPLIPKDRGKAPMTSTRRIRQLVQFCFDHAVDALKEKNLLAEAEALSFATAHWLRHTGISDDINKRHRPVAHVRDDAGHSSSGITDRYNDIELSARYESAKEKTLMNKPKKNQSHVKGDI